MKFTQTLMNTTLKKNRKILVVFDGMIADMVSNKTLHKLLLNCLFVEETKYFTCFYHRLIFFSTKKMID